jgi:hypothetical protein
LVILANYATIGKKVGVIVKPNGKKMNERKNNLIMKIT